MKFLNKDLVDLSDEKLMELVKQHESKEAFDQVYTRYFHKLCKYISWLSSDTLPAEDIVQNVFLKLLANPHSFDANKVFSYWIYKVAKNQFLNEKRNHSNRTKQLDTYQSKQNQVDSSDDVLQESDSKKKLVQSALNHLSEKHREVFVLKYSSNFSIKEISEIVNSSPGTIKSRLFYGIKEIKNQLQQNKNTIS